MIYFAFLLQILLFLYLFILVTRLLFVPLALIHEIRRRRIRARQTIPEDPVAVVIPAYNEATVIAACVSSILQDRRTDLEVVVVDDGSTDETAEIVSRIAATDPRLRLIRKENAGKGAALNTGFAATTAEYLLFIDADSVFKPNTIDEMLLGFRSDSVGAVCGDDRPVNLNHVIPRFLALVTHLGTGLVRRAFDVLGCVPVVSGNSGAFRRTALNDIFLPGQGPLREDTVGEDLELTWRLHRSSWQVAFAPRALVLAESPSTITALWNQRVRWARGLLQGLRFHWTAMFRPRYGIFGPFLVFTLLTMVFIPIIQAVTLLAIIVTGVVGGISDQGWTSGVPGDTWGWLLATGLALSLPLLLLAMMLGQGLKDLRHIWTLPLWPIYSMVINFTLVQASMLELSGAANAWNKAERSGINSFAPVSSPVFTNSLSKAQRRLSTTID